jgi:hypothetical protein
MIIIINPELIDGRMIDWRADDIRPHDGMAEGENE